MRLLQLPPSTRAAANRVDCKSDSRLAAAAAAADPAVTKPCDDAVSEGDAEGDEISSAVIVADSSHAGGSSVTTSLILRP